MLDVISRKCLAQKFRIMENKNVWIQLLQSARGARGNSGFNDRGCARSDKPEDIADSGDISAFCSCRSRHRDKDNIAVFYFFFILKVRLFKCIAHDSKAAPLQVVGVIFPYVALADESYAHGSIVLNVSPLWLISLPYTDSRRSRSFPLPSRSPIFLCTTASRKSFPSLSSTSDPYSRRNASKSLIKQCPPAPRPGLAPGWPLLCTGSRWLLPMRGSAATASRTTS